MKTWRKTDLLGLISFLFGIFSLVFVTSQVLAVFSLLISSLCLLFSVYDAKFDSAKYKDLLCHYQAVLSSDLDGWIAWNKNNEYINASKKFKNLFGFKGPSQINFVDILPLLHQQAAEDLAIAFNQLRRTGQSLDLCVCTVDEKKMQIHGSKLVIEGLETIVLWCRDITDTFNMVSYVERELQQAKAETNRFKEILDALPIQVWRRNNQLEISYCNKYYAESVNTNAERVILHNIPLIPGTIFGMGHSLAENVQKSGREQHIEHPIVITGHRRKLSIHERPANEGELIGYALDMTENESLSADIDKIVTANCEVMEHLSIAIAIFGEDMRLSFFNSAYQRLMKMESAWLYSKPTYSEVLDERRTNRQLPEHADFQAFKKSQLEMFTSITSPIQDLVHLPNNNTLRMLVAPYPLGGLLFMYEDVTDSLSLQRRNNTLLAVQRETLDHLNEGIIVYGSDNRIKIANTALQKIWNLTDESLEDFKGIHLSEVLDKIKDQLDYGDDWESFREHTISNLTDRISKTGRLIKKDDSIILFTYTPLPDGAHMNSFQDITDTCKVEKAILDKNQAIKSVQNLRFEFISCLSAELKEPLNSLIGFGELLLDQYFGRLNPKQQEYCRYILSASHQLHELINNLLDMVSIDIESAKLDISPFSLKRALEEVIGSVEKRAMEKNIDIVRDFGSDVIYNGDKIRIKQAIFNIMINAIQFTSNNGKINFRVLQDNDDIKILIKHEGLKYRKFKTDRRFKRDSGRGSNLTEANTDSVSLPLVKSLIEAHGGTLSISSDSDSNSTNIICVLPLHSDKLQPNEIADEFEDLKELFEEPVKVAVGNS